MEIPLLEYLAAGGDLATLALIYIFWKFDRRLLRIELTLFAKEVNSSLSNQKR
jgi:hypothetical protein